MLNKKLAGLFLVPALLFGMNASHALSDTASQKLEATLGTYLDITAVTDDVVVTTTISPDTGALGTALISKFKVNSNTDTQNLYLQATTTSDTGTVNALFQKGGTEYIVFSNTLTGKLPTTEAIENCKGGSPSVASNANAIAYPIQSVAVDNNGTATYDAAKNQYNVTAGMGTSIATTTTGTTPLADTYSFADNAGTYQAIVTLTSTTL